MRTPSVSGVALLVPVRIACDLLATALEREPGLEVRARGTMVDELTQACKSDPELVLVYDGSTADAVRNLRGIVARLGMMRVVVFGLAEAPDDLRLCADARVKGVVARSVPLSELAHAIRCVGQDEHFTSNALGPHLLELVARTHEAPEDGLTDREREIADRIGRGLSNGEICADLHVRPGTLKSHVRSIYRKLGVHVRADVVRRLDVLPAIGQHDLGTDQRGSNPGARRFRSQARRTIPTT